MNGSALSRWSRHARTLPSAAAVIALVAALPSCAGKPKEQGAPQPKEAPAPKPQASAEAPKSKATTTPAPTPAPQPVAAEAAKPDVPDSAAIAQEFCKKIATEVKKAIKADSAPSDPNAVVRKIVPSVPEGTANIALAKNTTCR